MSRHWKELAELDELWFDLFRASWPDTHISKKMNLKQESDLLQNNYKFAYMKRLYRVLPEEDPKYFHSEGKYYDLTRDVRPYRTAVFESALNDRTKLLQLDRKRKSETLNILFVGSSKIGKVCCPY